MEKALLGLAIAMGLLSATLARAEEASCNTEWSSGSCGGSLCPPAGLCDDPGARDAVNKGLTKWIRLEVHNVDNAVSTSNIADIVNHLNASYAPHGIQFKHIGTSNPTSGFAPVDDDPEAAYLIGDVVYDTTDRVNLVISKVGGFTNLTGKGTFPWHTGLISMKNSCWVGNIFAIHHSSDRESPVHEIGHVLGLVHPSTGTVAPPVPLNCLDCCNESVVGNDRDRSGDFCSDTPPTREVDQTGLDCNATGYSDQDCSGSDYDFSAAFANYMYKSVVKEGTVECANHFTPQQASRMHCWIMATDLAAGLGFGEAVFENSYKANIPSPTEKNNSRAISWADYDNDGDDDLFILRESEASGGISDNQMYRYNASTGNLEPVSIPELEGSTGSGRAATWGDYDNDGDLDLYVASWTMNKSRLFQNEGNGNFTDVTMTPLSNPNGAAGGATWVDYDCDGDLDLFITREAGTAPYNNLFQNNDGVFTDVTPPELQTTAGSFTSDCAWADYDGDGDPDVCLVVIGSGSKLLRNTNGSFTDVTPTALSGISGLGANWVDVDNDADLDLFLFGTGSTKTLLQNDGGDNFSDITVSVNIVAA